VILQPIVPSFPLQRLENMRFAVEKKYPLHDQLDYMFLQYYQIFPLRNPRRMCLVESLVTSGVSAGHLIYSLCQRYLCVSRGDVKVAYQKSFLRGEPALPQPRFKHDYGGESNPALPQPCFQHDRRTYLSDTLPGSCQCQERKR